MAFIIFLSTIFILLALLLDRKSPKTLQDQTSVKLRGLYEIENTYGSLNLEESQELAWPFKQSISIKYPNDTYARLANVNTIEDDSIKYIGTTQDCWLRLEPVPNCDIRSYHWGFIRSRG